MYRVFDGTKLRELRGKRSRREIAEMASGLQQQDLYAYERNLWRPSQKKVVQLLKALNCRWEDISKPVEPTAV